MPGTIIFKPIQASLTHNTEWIGKMDPYCLYHLGDQKIKGQICKKGGKEPSWEDAVTIPFTDQTTCVIDLKDKDILIDDKIGTFEIDLHEVETQGRLKKWYPIFYKEKPAGEILMETIFSNDPSNFGLGMSQPTSIPKGDVLFTHETTPIITNPTFSTPTHTLPTETVPTYNLPSQTTPTHNLPSKTTPTQTFPTNPMPTIVGTQPTFLVGSVPSTEEQYAAQSLMHGVDPLNTNVTNLYNNQQGLYPVGSKVVPLGTGTSPMDTQGVPLGTGTNPLTTEPTYTASNIGTFGKHTHEDHYPNQQMPFGHGHHMPTDEKNPMRQDEEFREEDLTKKY